MPFNLTTSTLACQYCGRSFTTRPAHVRTVGRKYCSLVCGELGRRIGRIADYLARLAVDPDRGCWLFTGAASRNGYGTYWWPVDGRTKQESTHRISIRLWVHPDIPEGVHVLHRCDVLWPDLTYRRCCNPDHLFAGTHDDNMADKVAKNRQARGLSSGAHTRPERVLKGSHHGRAKLNEADIIEIRARVAAQESQSQIGRAFGVSEATISAIWTGRLWRHVALDDPHLS